MKPEFKLFADAGVPHPCCVPSLARAVTLQASRQSSAGRLKVSSGSTAGMVKLDGGPFLMGTDSAQAFPRDGEGPVREVSLDPFYIDATPLTNLAWSEFVNATGYRTESERLGWSFVFQGHLPAERYAELVDATVVGVPWWCKVQGASWNHPEGPESNIAQRDEHPVVHVSWNDAAEYASWAGKRLPTEAEWEFAGRGGLVQNIFPWGDELTPDGKHMCNVWQGTFPANDLAEDGYSAPAPVKAFAANGYGLYAIAGNTWEWCRDWFHFNYHLTATRVNPVGPAEGAARVMKGGSYLCHDSYCNRYRLAARTSNTPDSATTNIGFRCARDI